MRLEQFSLLKKKFGIEKHDLAVFIRLNSFLFLKFSCEQKKSAFIGS